MIKIGLFALLTSISIVTSEQTEGKSTISFQVGPSFPVGSFANTEIEVMIRFAKTGMHIEPSYNC